MVKPLKGMNLGGWLVLEKWMTPSIFAGTTARNEFELSRTKQGRESIKKHHKTFIVEKDLKWLKEQGVEILRVPIGYWVFGDDKRYVGAIERLDWLVTTSLSYGFKVLIDLHAAPGAQNNAAHSGSGNTNKNQHSTKWFNDPSAQQQTIEILERIAKRYYDYPSVWGIQLLNEPSIDRFGLRLARFYRRAYKNVCKVARPGTRIVFSDAYAPLLLTNLFWLRKKKDFPVVMDCHIYQVFGVASKKRTFNQVIKRTKMTKYFLHFLHLQQPIIVGEWSAMLPYKVLSAQTREYTYEQRKAFSYAEAEFFWSYKTEGAGRWNYRDITEKNVLQ